MAVDFVRLLMDQASASGSKSTVLTDLRWFLLILMIGTLGAIKYSGPIWLLVLLGSLLGACSIFYFVAYAYFAIKSPDALRSERYTLSKMALEKNLIGDNLAGLTDETPKGAKFAISEKGGSGE